MQTVTSAVRQMPVGWSCWSSVVPLSADRCEKTAEDPYMNKVCPCWRCASFHLATRKAGIRCLLTSVSAVTDILCFLCVPSGCQCL